MDQYQTGQPENAGLASSMIEEDQSTASVIPQIEEIVALINEGATFQQLIDGGANPVLVIAAMLINGITPEELLQQGVPQEIIDEAMSIVQQEMAQAEAGAGTSAPAPV